MTAVVVFRNETLAKVAERAGGQAGVRVVTVAADEFRGCPADAGLLVVPLEDLEHPAVAGRPASVRLAVYGRAAERPAAGWPAGALWLDAPFRAAGLAAVLSGSAAAPAPAPAAASERPSAAPAPAPAAQPGVYRVLAADDDKVIRRLYETVLREAGYQVLLAVDGEDAWEKLPGFAPDLVISDLEMPRLDGYGLCKRVKENPQWAQVPFVICSSLSQGRDVEKAFESGTDDYLIKPINEDELLSRVRELLASIEQSGRESILAVDDSRIIRNLVRGGLAKQGFQVETAEDGRAALEKIEAMDPAPAVVISDFEMPGMTGFELGMELRRRERTRGIPLIIMSARDDTHHRKLMRTAGAVGFLAKPFEPDKMVALVERVLAEERLKAEKSRIRELIADDAMAQVVREVRLGKRSVAQTEQMTLLFSDLKGFSTMCSRMSAPEVVDLLNRYFDAMVVPIRANEGDIDKFIGDAIMARFRDPDDGAPRDPGPLRAVRAGLAMQAALQKYDAGLPPDRQLHMRIGINCGEVVIGSIGASSRRDYTTIGDNVNRAQRLEANAKPDGVLISTEVYERVKDRVRAERRPERLALKGIPEPVDVYDVLGLREGDS